MIVLVCLKAFLLAPLFYGIGNCEKGSSSKYSISRSYEVPYSMLNTPQGLQYYTTGQLYTAVPTVLIPSQITFPATPIPNVVYQPKEEPKPVRGVPETSSLVKTNDAKATHYHKQKFRSFGLGHVTKRPAPYHNSVHPYTVRLKPVLPVQTQKASASLLQSGHDTRTHYVAAASNAYPSTVGPPSPTYSISKAIDYHPKYRVSGTPGQAVYHRMKGSSHRHPMFTSKKIYSHIHKDHIHNHYFPANHPSLPNKEIQPVKYAPQIYTPSSPLPSPGLVQPGILQQNYKTYDYNSANQVRFPAEQETVQQHSLGEKKPSNAPGGLTQAIIKNPGVIANYDSGLPLKVPSKKPYKFEVNEILKNADLHFAQETESKENENDQNYGVVQYTQSAPFVNGLSYSPHQIYTTLPVSQASFVATNPLDVYSFSGSTAYQNNQIADQDSGTAETVKVPVAIIRGAHNVISPSLFGFPMKRQDEKASENLKKDFTPSKRTSDWIPTTGNGVPLLTTNDAGVEKPVSEVQETYPDDSNVFTSLNSDSSSKKTVRNRQVGDIISAKIPEEFAPKEGDIVGSNMAYMRSLSYDRDRRKGSVVDVNSSTASDASQTGDTSNLVVSSVIKFS